MMNNQNEIKFFPNCHRWCVPVKNWILWVFFSNWQYQTRILNKQKNHTVIQWTNEKKMKIHGIESQQHRLSFCHDFPATENVWLNCILLCGFEWKMSRRKQPRPYRLQDDDDSCADTKNRLCENPSPLGNLLNGSNGVPNQNRKFIPQHWTKNKFIFNESRLENISNLNESLIFIWMVNSLNSMLPPRRSRPN